MRNTVYPPLLLPLVMLIGCGGSSDPSNNNVVAQVFSWQIINLKTVAIEDIEENCIVFSASPSDNSQVITASVANTNYNILFHNADGSLLDDYTISSSDIADSGIVSIDSGLVPTGGYVSLEEVESSLSDQSNVYMFSVAKSLLSDLVLNVRLPQTGSDCYLGDDYSTGSVSGTNAVSVLQEQDVTYYQTSYSHDLVSGHNISANIPVLSTAVAQRDVLVTAFLSSDNEQNTDLSYFAFIDFSQIYDSSQSNVIISTSLNNAGLAPMFWQKADNLSIEASSAINIIHSGTSYNWQYLYDDIDQFTIAADHELISQWTAVFLGHDTTTGWQFTRFQPIDDSSSIIELALPEVASVENMALLQDCSIGNTPIDYCIDLANGFIPDDYGIQRSHIRIQSHNNTRIMFQTIYGLPSLQQPLLQSSALQIQPSATARIEISLMDGAIKQDKLHYFMSKHLDINTLAETSEATDFHDVNGYVTHTKQDEVLYKTMLMTDVTLTQHGIE
ncbi:MAG: hypothetical protein JKY14_09520 [Paraglaciecola sp.]|nr:hypothetical protein [Paraglaciecola sp.]